MKKVFPALGAMLLSASAYAESVATGAAEGTAATGASLMDLLPTLGFMVLMIVVFYFLLIRPQKKKDKAVKDMLAALKTGDRICTIGGIYGTITGLREDTVTMAVGPQKVPMMFARWAIRSVEDAPLENDSEPLV